MSIDELSMLVRLDRTVLLSLLATSPDVVIADDNASARFTDASREAELRRGISPSIRSAIEGEVAALLAERGTTAARVAAHFARAGRAAAGEAARWLRRAGNEMASSDPAAAADYLQRAAAAAPANARDEILDDLLDPLLWLDRRDDAAEIARDLLARSEGWSSQTAARDAALTLALAAEVDGDNDELLRSAHPNRWSLVVVDRRRRALRRGEAPQESLAVDERVAAPVHAAAEALALLDTNAAVAHQRLREGLEIVEQTGAAVHRPLLQWALAVASYVTGVWDDPVASIDDTAAAFQATARLHRGEPTGATAAAWVRCLQAEASGDAAEAGRQAAAAFAGLDDHPIVSAAMAPDLVRVLVSADLLGPATALLATMDANADSTEPRAASARRAAAVHCRGIVEKDAALLEEVARSYALVEWRAPHAFALGHAAVVHATAGNHDAARRAAKEALTGLASFGAAGSVQQLRRHLRDLNVRVGAPVATADTGTTNALTAAEQRVAELVAEGLPNREVADRLAISRYTVDAHLRRIYTKLGVSSRTELAARLPRGA